LSDLERVLILALRGRDAQVIAQVLTRQGHLCVACRTVDELAEHLVQGAGAALVTEESLAATDLGPIMDWLDAQPSWSDFPFILLATKRVGRRPQGAGKILQQLGNVVVLERPVHSETLASAIASAMRGRRRQYESRQQLRELEEAKEKSRQLNETLEQRIAQRTQELGRANDQLVQEIAHREKAQVALVQSQKMEALGQLTGGIAHDFNNLLTVIGGNLELIHQRLEDKRMARLVDSARQAAARAAKLTNQLLGFSRSQGLQLRPVDLNELIGGMNDLLARTIGPLFRVEITLDPREPWAVADVNQLELAILNLAINARDAMSEGGALRVLNGRSDTPPPGLEPGSYAVISVSDSGSGIAPELLEKVFDPFFTTKPLGKGTGLGLSQVYGVARQSGGTVRIDSQVGVGTTVEIWLPEAPRGARAAPEQAVGMLASAGGGERILVVEDDDGVRAFMVECLKRLGYSVTEASRGREGLDHIRADAPNLLIVDFAMPDLNGVEVVGEAREIFPGLPIILATGYADMDAVGQVIAPDRVLRKPFQLGDLERAVRDALSAA
jgi:signal transduction histidine kinase